MKKNQNTLSGLQSYSYVNSLVDLKQKRIDGSHKRRKKRPQCLSLPLFLFTLFSILRDACEYSSIITFMTFMDEHFSVHRQFFFYFSSVTLPLLSVTHLKLNSNSHLRVLFLFIVHRKQASFISLYRFDEAIIRYICAAALTRHQSHRIIATNAILFIVCIQLLH